MSASNRQSFLIIPFICLRLFCCCAIKRSFEAQVLQHGSCSVRAFVVLDAIAMAELVFLLRSRSGTTAAAFFTIDFFLIGPITGRLFFCPSLISEKRLREIIISLLPMVRGTVVDDIDSDVLMEDAVAVCVVIVVVVVLVSVDVIVIVDSLTKACCCC